VVVSLRQPHEPAAWPLRSVSVVETHKRFATRESKHERVVDAAAFAPSSASCEP
jgi:hypothetical protein